MTRLRHYIPRRDSTSSRRRRLLAIGRPFNIGSLYWIVVPTSRRRAARSIRFPVPKLAAEGSSKPDRATVEKTGFDSYPGLKNLLGTSSSRKSSRPGLTSNRAFGPPERYGNSSGEMKPLSRLEYVIIGATMKPFVISRLLRVDWMEVQLHKSEV